MASIGWGLRPPVLLLLFVIAFLLPGVASVFSSFRGSWRSSQGASPDEIEGAIQAIEPTIPPTVAPKFNQSMAPTSPRHSKDLSPTDAGEYTDNALGKVADVLDPIPAGMPELFEGASCRESCLGCMVSAAEYGEADCVCQSECLKGPMDDLCRESSPGWSNELVSKPDGHYVAKCGVGQLQCSDCTLEASATAIADCKGNLICLHKVLDRLLAAEKVQFCTLKQMSTCERFEGGQGPQDEVWTCFKTEEKCLASKVEAPWLPPSRKHSHCTWCDIAGAPPPS